LPHVAFLARAFGPLWMACCVAQAFGGFKIAGQRAG